MKNQLSARPEDREGLEERAGDKIERAPSSAHS